MKTITISTTYKVLGTFGDLSLTECGKIINHKRGIICKQFWRGSKKAITHNGNIVFVDLIKWGNEEVFCPF